MFTWLMNHLATVLVFILLLAVLIPILVTVIRNKKKGKSYTNGLSGIEFQFHSGHPHFLFSFCLQSCHSLQWFFSE